MIVESLKEEKMYEKFSNNVEAEQRGSYLDVEGIKWMLYRGVGRRSEAKNEFEIDVRRSDLEMESGSYWLDKVRTSIWRDVRTLAIEEAYTTKYSIHPGADTMLCGFRLTNRWLSMKKDIASCGSKLWVAEGLTLERCSKFGKKDKLEPSYVGPFEILGWIGPIVRELIHYCLQNPPYTYQWAEKTVPVAEGSSETTTERYMENYNNVSQDIRDQLNAEVKSVQIILTGIDNDIYSTIMIYCSNACRMWKSIERLKQCESTMFKILKTNYNMGIWKISHHGMANAIKSLKDVARTANPLALVAQQQPVYHPQNHPTQNTQYSSTRSNNLPETKEKQLFTVLSAPTYDPEPATVTEDEEMSKEKEIGKLMLNAEQADWKDDTFDESDDQELEAHYMYMAQIQEVTPDPVDNSGPIFDDEPMHKVQNNNDNYNVFAMENKHPEQLESSNDRYLAEQGLLMVVPISTREPKHNVNQSVATSSKKTVATDSIVKKSRNITRKLYDQLSKTCNWWYPKYTPPGYNWKPKSQIRNLVEIILFIVDSGCSKHMTENLKLLTNFVDKFLGTVKFGNDQIAPILGYGDLVQGTITIKRVYYIEGLNHNLFSVGQFCDADLEVAF
ncbi:hypothetical protein Tco_1354287 [Tanacetum coccineum]